MTNADKFLDAYEIIRGCLCTRLKTNKYASLSSLVYDLEDKDSTVRMFKDELLKFAELRNVIVHERIPLRIIADPRSEIVARICMMADRFTSPPRAIPNLKVDVDLFSPEDTIGKVVTDMQAKSYSQVPVVQEDGMVTGLLTTDTIVRWLASEVANDLVCISDTPLSKVMNCADKTPKNEPDFRFAKSGDTLFTVLDMFEAEMHKGQRLDAILITTNGKNGETLLGIATVWDIPLMLSKTKVK